MSGPTVQLRLLSDYVERKSEVHVRAMVPQRAKKARTVKHRELRRQVRPALVLQGQSPRCRMPRRADIGRRGSITVMTARRSSITAKRGGGMSGLHCLGRAAAESKGRMVEFAARPGVHGSR